MANKGEFFFSDTSGKERVVGLWIQADDDEIADLQLLELKDRLAACSGAALYKHQLNFKQVLDATPTPADGPYSLKDRAVLLFKTAIGTYVRYQVPAPIAAIFLDDDVVDSANELIDDVVTAALACLTDVAGNLVTSFERGYRSRFG